MSLTTLRAGVDRPKGERLDDVTAEIKRALDIVEWIGQFVRLEAAGAQFKGLCPFHDDHKPSFLVDPRYQNYRCWACGAKGDLFTFVQAYEKVTFAEAKARLAERAGIDLGRKDAGRSDPKQSLFRILAWAQEVFHKFLFAERTGAEARQYLLDRGLTEDTIREHGLGFSPRQFEWLIRQAWSAGFTTEQLLGSGLAKKREDRNALFDTFRGRVLFPIRDERGRVLGFGGRILPSEPSQHAAKYLNTAATEIYYKSQVLYGIEVAARELAQTKGKGARELIVMEGYTDCLMAYQFGLKHAVATCGTALTTHHVRKLRSFADRVVLMFDGDKAGQEAAGKVVQLFLDSDIDLRLCTLPDRQDPCDFLLAHGLEALREEVRQARDAIDFVVDQSSVRPGQELDEQAHALEGVLKILAESPSVPSRQQAIRFDLALSRLSTRSGVSEGVLRTRIREMRGGERRYFPAARNEMELEAEPVVAMDPRERAIVQWLVARPGVAVELLDHYPVSSFRHPQLRRIAQACQAVVGRLGSAATVDSLREELADPKLDDVIFEFLASVPAEAEFSKGLEDIKQALAGSRLRAVAGEARRRLAPQASVDEHLAVLRRILDPDAAK